MLANTLQNRANTTFGICDMYCQHVILASYWNKILKYSVHSNLTDINLMGSFSMWSEIQQVAVSLKKVF